MPFTLTGCSDAETLTRGARRVSDEEGRSFGSYRSDVKPNLGVTGVDALGLKVPVTVADK
jgi:hypothetical protein